MGSSGKNFVRGIKQLYLQMNHQIDAELQAFGLARSQFQVIYFVHKAGKLTQKELQQSMRIKAATLTGIIDVLTKKGLIQRSENKLDKRSNVLRLTGKGRRLGEKIPSLHEVIEERMFRNISAAEKKAIGSLIDQMTKNLED